MARKSLVILFSLKFELENCAHLIRGVEKYLSARWWTKKAAYMQRSVSFVVVTPVSEEDLIERLRPVVEKLGATERFWVFEAARFAKSSEGGDFDPFRSALLAANEELRHPTYFKNMGQPQRLDRHFRTPEHGNRGAVGEVFVERGSPRKPTKHPESD